MRHIWSVLCSKGIIDRKSNNASLIEVIEELKLVTEIKGPRGEAIDLMGQMPADLVTLWVRSDTGEPEKGHAQDTIISPLGKIIIENEYEVDLQNYKRSRATRRIMLPPASESGIYLFRIQLRDEQKKDWKTVAEIPLDVTIERVESEKQV